MRNRKDNIYVIGGYLFLGTGLAAIAYIFFSDFNRFVGKIGLVISMAVTCLGWWLLGRGSKKGRKALYRLFAVISPR